MTRARERRRRRDFIFGLGSSDASSPTAVDVTVHWRSLSWGEGVTKDTNPLCCACFVVSAARCCLHGDLPSSSSPPRKAGGDFSYVSDCAFLSLSTDPFPFFLFLFGGRRWCCEGNGRFILQSDSFPALTRGSCVFCGRSAGVEFVSVCSWVPSVGASLKSRQHAEPKRKKGRRKQLP